MPTTRSPPPRDRLEVVPQHHPGRGSCVSVLVSVYTDWLITAPTTIGVTFEVFSGDVVVAEAVRPL